MVHNNDVHYFQIGMVEILALKTFLENGAFGKVEDIDAGQEETIASHQHCVSLCGQDSI